MRPLLKHGEFIAPEAAASVEKQRQEPNRDALNGIVQRFGKHRPAAEHASPMGNLCAIYADAVQFAEAAASPQMRGLGLMFVSFTIGLMAWVLPEMYVAAKDAVRLGSVYALVVQAVLVMFGVIFFPAWVRVGWRMDMFAAEDQPTIFDRKHRKIYRLFTPLDEPRSRVSSRFKPIELQAVEYDWNHVTAEHRVELVTSGQTVSRIHRLVMIARDRPKPGEKQGRLLE